MSKKLGIVKVKSDITKFTEIMARDYELEAFEVTGILAQVLIEWQKRELIESNDEFSKVLKDLRAVITPLFFKEVQRIAHYIGRIC